MIFQYNPEICSRLYNHVKCNFFFPSKCPVNFSVLLLKKISSILASSRQKVFSRVCLIWKKSSLLSADRLFYLSKQSDGVTHNDKNFSQSLFVVYLRERHFGQAGTIPLRNKDRYHKNLHGNKFIFWYLGGSEIIWPFFSKFVTCLKYGNINPSCAEVVATMEVQESYSASLWQDLKLWIVLVLTGECVQAQSNSNGHGWI